MAFNFSIEDLELLTYPVNHLNGTGKEKLKEEYLRAFTLLDQAMDAFYKTTFHQRDFYPIDDDACSKFYKARALRWKVQMMYRIIMDYLQAHVEHIENNETADWIMQSLKEDMKEF